MKNLIFSILLLICASGSLLSQIYVGDAKINITAGAVLYSAGDITNAGSSTLTNEGTLSTLGDIINSGTATLQGDGQYTLEGDWTNSATFIAGNSIVTFEGAANSTVTSGGNAFYNIELSKTTADLLLADHMIITKDLNFVSDDNKVSLGNNDLIFGASALITSYDGNEYIITGGTGEVKKTGLGTTEFVFPVGFDASTYNPLTLVQSGSGTVDEFGVRVLENVLADGGSGLVLTEGVVDASWEVTEAVAGGSDLTLTGQWAGSDELTGFDRNDSGISRYDGTGWDLTNADAGAAAGADPYTRTRSGVADVGFFAVGSEALLNRLVAGLKVFLEGPFSNGLMGDELRTFSLIPTTEPYTALSGFTHFGRGGGETVDPSVFTITGSNAIVDWVFLELRNGSASSNILDTRSALIQRDGDIVNTDGTSPLAFLGMADDDYYVAIRHRNHLGVRSATTLTLPLATPPHDFSTELSQVWADPLNTSNPSMQDLDGTSYGLFQADVNSSGTINVADLFLTRVQSTPNQNTVYLGTDVNLNGNVNLADVFLVRTQSTPNKSEHLD